MRLQIAVGVRVTQRNLELSGSTSWLTAELLAFTLRGRALSRGPATLRLELAGTKHTVTASIRILTAELGGVAGRNLYTARIQDMGERDRERMLAWLEERSVPASRSTSRSVGTPGGRGRLGSALSRGLERGREGPPLPEPPPALEPEEELVLAPTVNMAPDGSGMSVAWGNWRSVRASWDESLSDGTLRCYLNGRHPPRGYSLIVQLCLPDGSVHAVMGKIGPSDGPTLYVDLTLKESTRKALTAR